LPGERRIKQSGQKAADFTQQAIDQLGRATGLILIEQRLIRARAECLRLGDGHLARQAEHPFQAGQGHREIIGRAGRAPYRLRLGFGARQGLDEIARHRRGMARAAPHLAQIGALPGAEARRLGVGRGNQVGDLGRREQLMGDAAQRRELLGARRAATRRHHGRGIPMQDRDRLLDRADAAKPRFQIRVRRHAVPLPGQW
jgi:hypothetical protein